LEDALAIQEAGAFAIVLEAIPEIVATEITKTLNIPTIGIGAGPQTSGQVLVQLDALGVYDKLQPKFSKVYETIGQKSIEALRRYGEEVKNRTFPASGINTYTMAKGEEELFKEWLKTRS
jgi:3-methyl-2-oxobutanoate hydroxymethyltransferase